MDIHIAGIGPSVDGQYELDWLTLTTREQHMVKLISGVRPAEFRDALMNDDAAFVAAVALVAVRRQGKLVAEDVLLDATAGTIRFVFPAVDAVPPTQGRRGAKPSAKNASGDSSDT